MKLDRIEVSGFKSIRELKLDLRPLNVLIGANGAGKSNFIAVFELLNHVMAGNFQSFVAIAGGAESLLYYGQKITENIYVKLILAQIHTAVFGCRQLMMNWSLMKGLIIRGHCIQKILSGVRT